MGKDFSNTLIYRAEFCFPSIISKSAFPDAVKDTQTIIDPPLNGLFENNWFLLKSITLGAVGPDQIRPFLIRKYHGFPFLFCPCYLQYMHIFLCLAVKAEAIFLFRYTRFGDSWRSWRTLLGVMGKFWDFCRYLELDCRRLIAFMGTTWTFSGAIRFKVLSIISHNCSRPRQFSSNETYRFSF